MYFVIFSIFVDTFAEHLIGNYSKYAQSRRGMVKITLNLFNMLNNFICLIQKKHREGIIYYFVIPWFV